MTREEAILHMTLRREELKHSVSDLDEDIKAFDMAIEALEQGSVLDKISDEIDRARFIDKYNRICKNALASGLEVAMQIIAKYKTESGE